MILNVTVASQIPWSIFAVAGMGIGLFMHWYCGVVRGDEFMEQHQQDIEHRIAAKSLEMCSLEGSDRA